MPKDIAGFDLAPGDLIVYSRHRGRSSSYLEYGTFRGVGKNCWLVTDRWGFNCVMQAGSILKLHDDSVETLQNQLLDKEVSL